MFQGFGDRSTDGFIAVTVDPGGVLTEEVGVGVTVDRGERAAIAGHESYGEWSGMKDRTSVTARKMFASGEVGLM